MGGPYRLVVEGAVANPLQLSLHDLDDLPQAFKVPDVSQYVEKFRGEGVRVNGLFEIVRPRPEATHATFYGGGGFAASVGLSEAERGILIYKSRRGYLSEREGGPVRLIIPAGSSLCNNVKSLQRIQVTIGKGMESKLVKPH